MRPAGARATRETVQPMYEDFFGLRGRPFELSPDPFFLFSSEKSKDALAAISYAISRRKGFVVMTGEVGTGKTLMLRCLFELWEREQLPFAYVIGPRLSTMDFLSYVTYELGLQVPEPTKGSLLRALYGFLLAQFEKGLTTILVIDEAHQVPRSVLEEIRLLANFETAQQKLIQVLLVGQPELNTKLDSPELRSLKQRIAVRCQLEPLGESEIRQYIERRLLLAGADSEAGEIFPADTIRAIACYSQGIPRLINSICDQAMIAAYARQVRTVPVDIIDQVANHFRLDPVSGLQPIGSVFPSTSRAANPPSESTWPAAPDRRDASYPNAGPWPTPLGREMPGSAAAGEPAGRLEITPGDDFRNVGLETDTVFILEEIPAASDATSVAIATAEPPPLTLREPAPATEIVLPLPAAEPPDAPANGRTNRAATPTRAVFQSGMIFGNSRRSRLRRWLGIR
jgi:general secretion pathway protein A